MMRRRFLWMIPLLIGIGSICFAAESGKYRLLSISRSEKLIVVSHIPSKTKYILDVASTKITVNGEPAEFRELKAFSVIELMLELKKDDRKGIEIDGKAIEISVSEEVPSGGTQTDP